MLIGYIRVSTNDQNTGYKEMRWNVQDVSRFLKIK